jgi:hypothetical protein
MLPRPSRAKLTFGLARTSGAVAAMSAIPRPAQLLLPVTRRAVACRIRLIGLRNTQIANDLVLFHGIDDDLRGLVSAICVEEDRFIDRAIALHCEFVIHREGQIVLVPSRVRSPEFNSNAADLLRLALAIDSEFDVIAFPKPAEFIDFSVILGDQSAQFAPRHVQVLLGALEIRLGRIKVRPDSRNLAAHRRHIRGIGLVGEFGGHVFIHRSQLVGLIQARLLGIRAGFLQLALRNAQPLGDGV